MKKILLFLIPFPINGAYTEDYCEIAYIPETIELIQDIKKSDQQYLNRINANKFTVINKYTIDYYICKFTSLSLIIYKNFNLFKASQEGTENKKSKLIADNKVQFTKHLNYIQMIYIAGELSPIITDLWCNEWTPLGEFFRLLFLSINTGYLYYLKLNCKTDIYLILLSVLNICLVNTIRKQQKPDIFLLKDISLNQHIPRQE